MKKKSTGLAFLCGLVFFVSCGQDSKPGTADKFLAFLNNYQADSLELIVADNFELRRTYSKHVDNKRSFIDTYVPVSKNFNGKYNIIKTTNSRNTTDFLVEDQSDYLKYLHIANPKWKIKIISNKQNKIESMLLDTTTDYQVYVSQAREKSGPFESWLKMKYPDDKMETLYNTPGLMTQRLKEYSTK